jgi:HK97 family phage prohead protease
MIHTRHFPSTLAIRDNGESRTLVGPLLPWGVSARGVAQGRLVTETFQRGALAGTDPARIPLTATHPRDNQTLPIGVTVELEERADAAWGAWRVSKTALGDEVLELARDGVPLGLSVGFHEVPGGNSWSPDRRRVVRTRAALDHVAVVRVPAYQGAGVLHPGTADSSPIAPWVKGSNAACCSVRWTCAANHGAASPAAAWSSGAATAVRTAATSCASAAAASPGDRCQPSGAGPPAGHGAGSGLGSWPPPTSATYAGIPGPGPSTTSSAASCGPTWPWTRPTCAPSTGR